MNTGLLGYPKTHPSLALRSTSRLSRGPEASRCPVDGNRILRAPGEFASRVRTPPGPGRARSAAGERSPAESRLQVQERTCEPVPGNELGRRLSSPEFGNAPGTVGGFIQHHSAPVRGFATAPTESGSFAGSWLARFRPETGTEGRGESREGSGTPALRGCTVCSVPSGGRMGPEEEPKTEKGES